MLIANVANDTCTGLLDVKVTLTFDLTPFAGLLNDGKAHTMDVKVTGRWTDRQTVVSNGHMTRTAHLDVAREDRHAVATTSERYRLNAPGEHYDHTLATEQGVLTEDVLR
uniref:hypothetical protein n=1 Tax=Streptomyces lincolnensis TaxID=1915 RepID=UPI001E2A43AA|nr:hypothetical protein [Streptomyces lincolnensis]